MQVKCSKLICKFMSTRNFKSLINSWKFQQKAQAGVYHLIVVTWSQTELCFYMCLCNFSLFLFIIFFYLRHSKAILTYHAYTWNLILFSFCAILCILFISKHATYINYLIYFCKVCRALHTSVTLIW